MNFQTLDLKFLGTDDTIAAYLIESTAGQILIECGPHSTINALEKALGKYGYRTDDIAHIFLTHIHLDHAGAAWYFAEMGCNIYVHPAGIKHLADPTKLMSSARMIYKDKMDALWGDMQPIENEQLIIAEHNQKFLIGDKILTAHHTPGHAVHHIAWQIEDVLFTGDVGGVKVNKGPVMPPCPPPDINIEDWLASIKLMRNLKIKQLQLTHFGTVTNVQAHFDELETILKDWAAWMKPYFDKKTEQAEIVPLFKAYVKTQLIEKGIKGDELLKYEHANPAWMSVAGLMRYWSKKA